VDDLVWISTDAEGDVHLNRTDCNTEGFFSAAGPHEKRAVMSLIEAVRRAKVLIRSGAPGASFSMLESIDLLGVARLFGLDERGLHQLEKMGRVIDEIEDALGKRRRSAVETDAAALAEVFRRTEAGELDWTQKQIEEAIGAPRKSLTVKLKGKPRHPMFCSAVESRRLDAAGRRRDAVVRGQDAERRGGASSQEVTHLNMSPAQKFAS
jgi:hypothetical protein